MPQATMAPPFTLFFRAETVLSLRLSIEAQMLHCLDEVHIIYRESRLVNAFLDAGTVHRLHNLGLQPVAAQLMSRSV